MSTHIFGIRHHGPGSARSLRRALERLQPDVVLVEGPPDAEAVLPLLAHAEMQPPVALLVYVPEQPREAVYYPFASFSPEWQAIRYALEQKVPVRFMDLPQWHQLHATTAPTEELAEALASDALPPLAAADPLDWLAQAAGYSDGERWWERMVEQRQHDDADLFAAVLEAMSVLRAEAPEPSPREAQREAWMRQTIRQAVQDGHQRIAVVCGAWHAPVLRGLDDARGDKALLKGLPKVKTSATWVPWTYGRLAASSGYGAGITSPGWYDHLWNQPDQIVIHWMIRVARLLRDENLDISAAHAIEAVRLAESLAALRGHPLPGLAELNEAVQAVFCFGNDMPMRLIHDKLIVGERLGSVPDATPAVPLQQDLQREQKRLKLQPEASWREIELDLRKPFDLDRSYLLRRLNVLAIAWGQLQHTKGTGTFREVWRIEWQPEFAVRLIEASIWGNMVQSAASNCAIAGAAQAQDLPTLVAIVNQALLADLPDTVATLMADLQARSVLTNDTGQLMDALTQADRVTRTSFVSTLRYGNVRKTDSELIAHVVDGIVIRICIGLPIACASLNDDAANELFRRIIAVNDALRLLQRAEQLTEFQAALQRITAMSHVHGLVVGRCYRILLDSGKLEHDEAERRISRALSQAVEPEHAAAWIEGLLRDSATLLIHDEMLWAVIDSWLNNLNEAHFVRILPLLRRTFATFNAPERHQLGERATQGRTLVRLRTTDAGTPIDLRFDTERAEAVLPLVRELLGV